MPENVDARWSESFFEGPWLDVQRQTWTPEQTTADADVAWRLLGLAAGAQVLDVPCGEGRVALALAERGARVTGVDVTAPLLQQARSDAQSRGLELELVERDMRQLDFDARFDAALCWWGSFGYFSDDGDERYARGVASALRPGGRFVIDTHVAETILPRLQPRGWDRVGDILVLQDRRYDHETGRIETEWTFLREGEPAVTRASSIRLYTFHELAALLRRAGFSMVQGLDREALEPFGAGARRLAMLATR